MLSSILSKAKLVKRSAQHCGGTLQRLCAMTTSPSEAAALADYPFETLKVSQPHEYVLHVQMNRPQKRNAMSRKFWKEIRECFQRIATDEMCRSVVLSGAGPVFSSGIDLVDCSELLFGGNDSSDVARRAFRVRTTIEQYQKSFTAIEECPKPVIAAIHNACIGAGVDLVCSCDIRYCSQDVWFQIKEVDIGLAADVGTLQRMPKIVGNDSLVRELAYTGRKLFCDEADKCGLISRRFPDKDALISGAMDTAVMIAAKSPVAVQGTKINLVYARDHTVQESLNYISIWNQCMLQGEDLLKGATAQMEKTKPVFAKL